MSKDAFVAWAGTCPPGVLHVATDPALIVALPGATRAEVDLVAPARFDRVDELPPTVRARVEAEVGEQAWTFVLELQDYQDCGNLPGFIASDYEEHPEHTPARIHVGSPHPRTEIRDGLWWSVQRAPKPTDVSRKHTWSPERYQDECGEHVMVYLNRPARLPILIPAH
jgi:hypothetical protein